MLHRVPADDTVRMNFSMLPAIEIWDKTNHGLLRRTPRHPRGIYPNPLIMPQFANETNKVALAAADFDHLFIAHIIFLYKLLRQICDKFNKSW